jgi:hypothetical protein
MGRFFFGLSCADGEGFGREGFPWGGGGILGGEGQRNAYYTSLGGG